MKSVRSIFIGLTCLGMATASFAQEEETTPEATTYKAEIFGSVASGDNTPFWMVSNRYGIVPLEANNGYLNAGVFHNQTFGKGFRWGAGLDVVAAFLYPTNICRVRLQMLAIECRKQGTL